MDGANFNKLFMFILENPTKLQQTANWKPLAADLVKTELSFLFKA